MRRITFIALLWVLAVLNVQAQGYERKSNLIFTCTRYEGVEMVGCYEYVYFNVRNETDAVEFIPADEGLHIFYTDFLENNEVKYTHVGSYYEDLIVQPGESVDIKIKVNHLKSKDETRFGVVGTFLDDNNKPTKTFCMVQFTVYPARDWDLTGTIQIEQIQSEDGAKVVGHATLTNNEQGLFTPFRPFVYLYKKTGGVYISVENNTIKTNWYEPGIPYTEDINFTRFEQGKTYYIVIKWSSYLGVNHDYEIARSEDFVYGETNAISSVSADEGLANVYTTDGKLIATGDSANVMDGLAKGLYIIKDNQGTRKVMK